MTGSATVVFSGTRGGEATLSWGQRLFWRAFSLMGPGQTFLNCPWVLPVYGKRDLDTVLDALRVLLDRHESLRSTFVDTPDGPVQRVARSGELTVDLVDAGDERPLVLADRLAGEMARVVFAHGEEWPLHCKIVVRDGRPLALALNFSHLAVDFHAQDLLSGDWRRLLRGAELPPATWHPMDQAELESTEPFQARSARSISYWQSVLEEVPVELFDHPPGQPGDPRFVEVGMESVALAVAATRLAERWTISTTSVLLAACATVLATVSGRPRAVLQVVHSNRRDPRTRTMVGTVGQEGLFVLDLPGSDFTATLQAAHRSALTAYRNALYDPFAMVAMREAVGRRRGQEPDVDAYFNDRSGAGWPYLPKLAPDANLASLTQQTRTYVQNTWPGARIKVMFTVGTAPDTGSLSLIVDTAYLSRDLATAMLRACESLLVRAVTEDIPMADVPHVSGITAYRAHL